MTPAGNPISSASSVKRRAGERGLLRGLEDGRVAGGERGAERAPEHRGRIVPRDDVSGDAARFAQHHHLVARQEGNGVAMDLVGGATVIFEVAGGDADVVAGELHRLAGICGLDLRELLQPVEDQQAEPAEQPSTLQGRHGAPGRLECEAGSGHGAIDVRGATPRDAPDDLAGAGVDHLNRGARGRLHPAAIDENLVAPHRHPPHSFFAFARMLLRSPGLPQCRKMISGIRIFRRVDCESALNAVGLISRGLRSREELRAGELLRIPTILPIEASRLRPTPCP